MDQSSNTHVADVDEQHLTPLVCKAQNFTPLDNAFQKRSFIFTLADEARQLIREVGRNSNSA